MAEAKGAAAGMSLAQKLVELRKALPKISKEHHSDQVSYAFAKIDDVWSAITPKMNELGVLFSVSKEENATCNTMMVSTRNGERLMFIYNADLTVIWTNADDPDDVEIAFVHAIGWNDDPAKAKGCAHTYALKYYLFELYSVDMSADDPDGLDNSATGRTDKGGTGYKGKQTVPQGKGGGYVYTWGKHKGMTVAKMEAEDSTYNDWLLKADKTEPELRAAIKEYRAELAKNQGEEPYPPDWPPEPGE